MARINFKLYCVIFGLYLLHTATGQTATATNATVAAQTAPAAGKDKSDQSTVVWSVDPALSGGAVGGTQGGQPEVNTPASVNTTLTTQAPVAATETSPTFIRQETTPEPMTSAPIYITPLPQDMNLMTRAPPALPPGVAVDPAASPNIRTDVTDTVMALLNETGYSGSANDANVQEIVAMLMNGTVPTDADLIRLGFIPQSVPSQATTPPPYSIPGIPPVIDPSLNFQTGALPTGSQSGPSSGSGTSMGGFPMPIGGFPIGPPIGTSTGTQSGVQQGAGGSTDPFGGALSSLGSSSGGFQNFQSLLGPPVATSKPALGDPFGTNTINGGIAGQLPNFGPNDLNALGPKPFPNAGPVGGLGTPGSPTDLLGPIGPPPLGLGNLPTAPQTGILETAMNQRNQGGNMMNNPMMMMMMMNPELMDQMMSGENPMLMYMMMQQMNRRPQRPRPTPPMNPGMGSLGGLGGFTLDQAAGGAGAMPLPLPGSPGMGAGPGGIMDLMNNMGAMGGAGLGSPGLGTAGSLPMDLTALTNLGATGGPTPGAAVGGNPMDLIQGSLANPIGPTGGPVDMTPFLNMINAGTAGTAPGGAAITDPFLATAG